MQSHWRFILLRRNKTHFLIFVWASQVTCRWFICLHHLNSQPSILFLLCPTHCSFLSILQYGHLLLDDTSPSSKAMQASIYCWLFCFRNSYCLRDEYPSGICCGQSFSYLHEGRKFNPCPHAAQFYLHYHLVSKFSKPFRNLQKTDFFPRTKAYEENLWERRKDRRC